MGDPLEERVEGTEGGHGRSWGLVRTDWGSEYCASSVAICEPGREEGEKRDELGVEGWGDTVHKTVPLIQTMRSRVLVPMPWSPVA